MRDSGPSLTPGFRPEDVIGLTTRRALIELAHEGFHAEVATADADLPRTGAYIGHRVTSPFTTGLSPA
jgi:hypothetical protein